MRLLRTITVWLLMAAASGTGPIVAACLDRGPGHRCGDTCTRCPCKKHPGAAGSLRAPCPCCGGHAEADAVTALPPAVLPGQVSVSTPPHDGSSPAAVSRHLVIFAPSVPHPPPRHPLPF